MIMFLLCSRARMQASSWVSRQKDRVIALVLAAGVTGHLVCVVVPSTRAITVFISMLRTFIAHARAQSAIRSRNMCASTVLQKSLYWQQSDRISTAVRVDMIMFLLCSRARMQASSWVSRQKDPVIALGLAAGVTGQLVCVAVPSTRVITVFISMLKTFIAHVRAQSVTRSRNMCQV